MLEAGLARLAAEFWELANRVEPFPRNLADTASLALPLVVRLVAALNLSHVTAWLVNRGIPHTLPGPNRRLRGCLLAYGGGAIIMLDESDPEDERRFTLAHEIAHFMLDYLEPRQSAIEQLGEGITPVLDGQRPPDEDERVHAILSRVPLGLHVNLIERTAAGGYTSRETLRAENRADLLALELLAPSNDAWASILALPEAQEGNYMALRSKAGALLREKYGLPAQQAGKYAAWLLKQGGRDPGARDWLGEQ